MTISQNQIVDILYKKLSGVAKTDVAAAKSPANESNASPQLSPGSTIWQQDYNIPAATTLPASNGNVITVYSSSTSSIVQAVALSESVTNSTWATNLTDWIPPQFGSGYQVQLYAGPAGATGATAAGYTNLPSTGSGNNDSWYFDYAAGIVNFADTTVPAAVAGNVVYVVGARYTGPKGITNFTGNVSIGNLTVGSSLTVNGVAITSSGSNANVDAITSDLSSVNANILAANVAISTLQSNIGSFYTWANTNILSSANVAISILQSNIGSFYTWANANSQIASINILNANVGAYETWANAAISSLYTGANANVAAYLSTNDITVQSVNVGNITINPAAGISASGSFGDIGQLLVSTGTANVTWASKFYVGATPPPVRYYGDIWYYVDPSVGIQKLYMWVNDGGSDFYYDFLPPTF